MKRKISWEQKEKYRPRPHRCTVALFLRCLCDCDNFPGHMARYTPPFSTKPKKKKERSIRCNIVSSKMKIELQTFSELATSTHRRDTTARGAEFKQPAREIIQLPECAVPEQTRGQNTLGRPIKRPLAAGTSEYARNYSLPGRGRAEKHPPVGTCTGGRRGGSQETSHDGFREIRLFRE